jgi:hypothetical protein
MWRVVGNSSFTKLRKACFAGVSEGYVIDRLSKAAGEELRSGKFFSEASSAFLAANTLGWFHG